MPQRLLPEPGASGLSAFQRTVRLKTDWYKKILDIEQDLGRKWAVEAGFLALEDLGSRKFLKIRDIFRVKFGDRWVRNIRLMDGTSPKGREAIYLCLACVSTVTRSSKC
jgi:hypothetical protein